MGEHLLKPGDIVQYIKLDGQTGWGGIRDEEAIPVLFDLVVSKPPSGLFRVTNLYVNELGRLVVEYEDIPQL